MRTRKIPQCRIIPVHKTPPDDEGLLRLIFSLSYNIGNVILEEVRRGKVVVGGRGPRGTGTRVCVGMEDVRSSICTSLY